MALSSVVSGNIQCERHTPALDSVKDLFSSCLPHTPPYSQKAHSHSQQALKGVEEITGKVVRLQVTQKIHSLNLPS